MLGYLVTPFAAAVIALVIWRVSTIGGQHSYSKAASLIVAATALVCGAMFATMLILYAGGNGGGPGWVGAVLVWGGPGLLSGGAGALLAVLVAWWPIGRRGSRRVFPRWRQLPGSESRLRCAQSLIRSAARKSKCRSRGGRSPPL